MTIFLWFKKERVFCFVCVCVCVARACVYVSLIVNENYED